MIVCFIAIVWLAGVVSFLFKRSDARDRADNEKQEASHRELQKDVANLRKERDSVINLVGLVRVESLQKEIDLKDKATKDLVNLNRELEAAKAELDQKFIKLQRTTTRANNISDNIINQSRNEN
jgi:predicted mannosyl-3-phosphoglycerate phosphatase (HAD superfamily)